MTGPAPFSGVLFGAAYYAEYQPAGTLDRDLDLMVKAGFTVIRVGESVWSTWEPREGEFDLDWLQPVLDSAHARGIGVILGTPTYAVPMWLARRHPEIAAEVTTGQRIGWGARQEMDQSHPTYRFYAERVARKVVARYADHPAVIGFQVDNEPGLVLPHNKHVFQRFVDWLRARYGTVERLNEEWGLVYWSHRLSDWADLWRPDGNAQPQYDLEWRRFQSTLATELVSWQAELVAEYARPDQFITTCISYSRPQIDDEALVAPLSVTAGNPYYRMQAGLDAGRDEPRTELWQHQSVWGLFQWGDRAWSSGQSPYLVTETNAQSTGQMHGANFPPYPGQIKQAALALVSRGGRMVEYWHWHTLHFGKETYWGGVLPHSQRPGRIYHEVAALGATLKALGSALDGYVPDADVLMLWSNDTNWAYETYSPLERPDGSADPHSWARIFDSCYRGLLETGAQVRIQHPDQFLATPVEQLVEQFPVLVAVGLYILSDAALTHLRDYAEAGGHLLLGPRTGYGDELGRARLAVAPALLHTSAGTRYDEYSSLETELPLQPSERVELEPGSAGFGWVDILQTGSADVLAVFEPTELGASSALTSRATGSGRVSYLATLPNAPLSRSIARFLVPAGSNQRWQTPSAVTVSSGRTVDQAIAFISNWSDAAVTVVPPVAVRDLESGTTFAAGDPMPLEPRAAVVLEVSDVPTGSAAPLTERTA